METGLCRQCPKYAGCTEPCEKLKALLDSPDKGRPATRISPRTAEEVRVLLDHAHLLDPRRRAIVNLYYRCSMTTQEIADAFGMNRSTVWRCLKRIPRRIFKKLGKAS